MRMNKATRYIEKITGKGTYRNWWLVKFESSNQCKIPLNTLSLPTSFAGKKIRLKVEIIGEDTNE